jgi:CYTH domain-containing protein
MGVETERKYIVHAAKWKAADKKDKHLIEQGYILNSAEKTVRVRLYDNKGFITIKGKTDGFSRTEFEYEIPVEDARVLLKDFCKSTIKKIRYKVLYSGRLWEVDEFLDENKGLLMAELELKSKDEQFALPEWIDKEVTGDTRYYNSYLSTNPYSTWK